jgi:hypothetical protein
MRIPFSRLRASLILVISLALVAAAVASHLDQSAPTPRANELLRQAVAKEQFDGKDGYYSWMDRVQKPRGTATKLMVSTPQGILSRTVALNDKPLSADERKLDDDRINRLLDSGNMRDKARKQREDQQHIERLLVALPDAFQCEYVSAARDERSLHLDCSPNPNFSAPNYESQVLQGMKAVIIIDREDNRISRIEGTLFKDVNFGWGFLGRLDHGGHIEITQSKVAGKHWGMVRMQLNFDGRIIVIKPLHIEETETSWDYHPAPSMTVAQALEYLRNTPVKPTH